MGLVTRIRRNETKWGLLVMSWATGRSLIDGVTEIPPPPNTIADLKELCTEFDIDIDIPDSMTELEFIHMKANTLAIRLPSKEIVEAVRELLRTAGDYDVPHYYEDLQQSQPLADQPQKKLELQANRVGDYSIANCA